MKKLAFVLIVALAACGDSKPKETVAPAATPEAAPVVVEKEVQSYFIGSGNEPGWNITMDASVKGTFPVVIVYDYGKETLHGELVKEGLVTNGKNNVASGEAKFSGTLKGSSSEETVLVSLISEECTDDAGKKHSHRCAVTVAGKKMTGCGDYVE